MKGPCTPTEITYETDEHRTQHYIDGMTARPASCLTCLKYSFRIQSRRGIALFNVDVARPR
ncbi:hypothetical protein DPMN_168761 [Dreissena polymorpha]|uniref:Uncharacterized protein n=1 Tax=Dreissena polymorpha TaxID=45954 RepID=A0A9D4F3D0_DREPO|nr:hypothetical protein DPMN_168761 [Dreissena polymorpha]